MSRKRVKSLAKTFVERWILCERSTDCSCCDLLLHHFSLACWVTVDATEMINRRMAPQTEVT